MKRTLLVLLFIGSTAHAAELMVHKGNGQNDTDLKDGDILLAFNDRRIAWTHAQNIASEDCPSSIGVRRDAQNINVDLLESTKEYKFERLDQTHVTRTNLWTGQQDVIGPEPNQNGEYMDVQLFIDRQLAQEAHMIFGTPGAEFWYGGGTQYDDTKLDHVWQQIETKKGELRTNHTRWPKGLEETDEKYAFIKVNDMSDERANDLASPKETVDAQGNKTVKAARKFKVNYEALPLQAGGGNMSRNVGLPSIPSEGDGTLEEEPANEDEPVYDLDEIVEEKTFTDDSATDSV